jgi:aspartate aminotransferase
MTGYRLGYLAAPLVFTEACTRLQAQITSCASSLAQHAGTRALSLPDEYSQDIISNMREKRDLTLTLLREIPHILTPTPQGAFYVFPQIDHYYGRPTPEGSLVRNSEEFCVYLLERFHVALVPGSAFGDDKAIRICYATSKEVLTDALEGLAACFASLLR